MLKARRVGIILFLIGFCLLIISLAFVSGYNKNLGLLGSVGKMEIVLKEGTWLAYPPGYSPPPAPLPAPVPPSDPFYEQYMDLEKIYIDPLKNFTPHYEGRIAMLFKYFFAIDILIIFGGILAMILSKANTKSH
ncbi:MAG: hypothetical protein QME44_03035 [Thermodesulfobacteriota bacterium]|nr:hypothetical protein [Thermodesulfobacteriota bacterium]